MKNRGPLKNRSLALLLCLMLIFSAVFLSGSGFGDNTSSGDDDLDIPNIFVSGCEYKISGDYILGVSSKTSFKEFSACFLKDYSVSASYCDGSLLNPDDIIKSGTRVDITGYKGSLSAVVSGDTNLDGILSVTDIVIIRKIILEKETDKLKTLAADFNQDGNTSVTDIIKVVEKINENYGS